MRPLQLASLGEPANWLVLGEPSAGVPWTLRRRVLLGRLRGTEGFFRSTRSRRLGTSPHAPTPNLIASCHWSLSWPVLRSGKGHAEPGWLLHSAATPDPEPSERGRGCGDGKDPAERWRLWCAARAASW